MTRRATLVFARKHPVDTDAHCYACGARLDWLGDVNCWFEVWRQPNGRLEAQEYHLKCEGEKRRTHS